MVKFNIIMKTIKLFLFLFLMSTYCSAQCRYEFIGAKISQNKNLSLNVGELHSNGNYSGLQGTMPLFGSHIFNMSGELGKGIVNTNTPWSENHVGLIGYVIAGLYVPDFGTLNMWHLNYGVGVQSFTKNVFLGFNYTNNEKLSIKFGFYLDSLDY